MPGLNAAFVNIGHEGCLHPLPRSGPAVPSLDKLVSSIQPGKRGLRLETMKLEEPVEKDGKIGNYLQVGQTVLVQVARRPFRPKGPV